MGRKPGRAPQAVTTRIGQAVILHRGGDREEARNRLRALWGELESAGGPMERMTVAHYLGQTQDDPRDGVAWDLRALAVADELVEERAVDATGAQRQRGGAVRQLREVRALYPRLCLSLASGYARLGDIRGARLELSRARTALGAEWDERHGADLRAAADRLERGLAES